jgi:hypothetical protein
MRGRRNPRICSQQPGLALLLFPSSFTGTIRLTEAVEGKEANKLNLFSHRPTQSTAKGGIYYSTNLANNKGN